MADRSTLLLRLAHCLPPETAHEAALCALSFGLLPPAAAVSSPMLSQPLFGLTFSSPVGLAAGFDKNAAVVDALLAQGFGFVEAGTVTPRPQAGNPRPRLFRLSEDRAIINRLGFNNQGLTAFVKHLRARKSDGIVGANIGKNKDSADAVADYVCGLEAVYPYADYVTINISSPNTPGLRALQQKESLNTLLAALMEKRDLLSLAHGRRLPLMLKVAPDLGASQKEDIATSVMAHRLDGLIISNTTIARPPSLKSPLASQQGGLSGGPLFAFSTETLKDFYRLTQGKIPLIGVGGISSAEDAYQKVRAGASLVQLYTALIYQGFGLVRNIQLGLVRLLQQDGFTHIHQAVGADV